MEAKNWSYFQYFKQLGLPIYLRLDLSDFHLELVTLLNKNNFTLMTPREVEQCDSALQGNKMARLLTLSQVAISSINKSLEQDEQVVSRGSYKLYRQKSQAMMIYSSVAKEWKMGVVEDFGSSVADERAQLVLGRFLSLALAPLGFVGLFGFLTEKELVLTKHEEAQSEIVFIDPINLKILSHAGMSEFKNTLQFVRLSDNLKSKKLDMDKASLLSSLSMSCSFMDSSGHSMPIRQLLYYLGKHQSGIIYPREVFRPRLDLSL